MSAIFTPLTLGALKLEHRVVLAPLTRQRGDPNTLVPSPLAVEYYRQRATKGGLLITEASPISPETIYDRAPGIWTDAQVEGWKKIVKAVHDKGGLISMQLWHIGRIAHPSFNEHPLVKDSPVKPTVSSSAVAYKANILEYKTNKKVPYAVPRPLETHEIETRLVQDYVRAARNARLAGFDAIEIHSAHGYLLDQFLHDNVNQRTDKFGGSFENRFRIIDLVLRGVFSEFPPERVGVRLSPITKTSSSFQGCKDSNPEELFKYVVSQLDKYKLAYLLLSEPRWNDRDDPEKGYQIPLQNPTLFKGVYSGKIIGAGGFTPMSAKSAVDKAEYDAVAFGRWFISNPDLPERMKDQSIPLTVYNRKTFYTGPHSDPEGYTDYPMHNEMKKEPKYSTVPQEKIGASLNAAKIEVKSKL